jgi:hypothetical protein
MHTPVSTAHRVQPTPPGDDALPHARHVKSPTRLYVPASRLQGSHVLGLVVLGTYPAGQGVGNVYTKDVAAKMSSSSSVPEEPKATPYRLVNVGPPDSTTRARVVVVCNSRDVTP